MLWNKYFLLRKRLAALIDFKQGLLDFYLSYTHYQKYLFSSYFFYATNLLFYGHILRGRIDDCDVVKSALQLQNAP